MFMFIIYFVDKIYKKLLNRIQYWIKIIKITLIKYPGIRFIHNSFKLFNMNTKSYLFLEFLKRFKKNVNKIILTVGNDSAYRIVSQNKWLVDNR